MQITASVATDVGKVRRHNEDSWCIDDKLNLFVVCDGMGGHAAGEVASKTAVNVIVRVLYQRREVITRCDGSSAAIESASWLLHEALQEASKTIFDVAASDRGKHGMGTTCVAMLVLGEQGLMANVGDSRLYLARDGKLLQLSTDHTFGNDIIASGMMTPEQAALTPHASALTRAVGVQPTVKVELLRFDVLPGDTFLLCSDGVYSYTADADLLASVLSAEPPASIPRTLVQRALDGGAHDNATALVVRVVSQEARQVERKSTVSRQLDALREIELFRALTMAELVKIFHLFGRRSVAAGEAPIREGEHGQHLFVIVEGRFEVMRKGQSIAMLGHGAHFGEMALLNHRPRSATVIAVEPSRLLSLDRAALDALMAREPVVAAKFLSKFAQTLSLRLDDAYLARDFRSGRKTLDLAEYPSPLDHDDGRPRRR